MSALTDAIELSLEEARATEAQLQARIDQIATLTTNVATVTADLTAAQLEIAGLQEELTAAQARIVELEALLPPPPPPAPPTTEIFLSDLSPAEAPINGWGPYARDQANGEQGASDGGPIRLRGTTYPKGLGVHARSVLSYDLGGHCDRFKAVIGIDDYVPAGNTAALVTFRVFGDGVAIYTSPGLTRSSPAVEVDLPVASVRRLRIEVQEGASTNSDHADWASARVSFATQAALDQFRALHGIGTPPPPPPPIAQTIGTVTVAGGGQYADGATVTLTASRSGNANDVVWSWTVPAGSGVTPSSTNVLTFPANAVRAGTYTATATSAGSSDSPRSGQAAITIAAAGGGPLPLTVMGWQVNATNTGIAPYGLNPATMPVYSGPYMPARGARITGMRINTRLNLFNGNIILERCYIAPTDFSPGRPALTTTDLGNTWAATTGGKCQIIDCEITGEFLQNQEQRAFSTGFLGIADVIRCNIHDIGSGIGLDTTGMLYDALIQHNYVHDLVGYGNPATTGSHVDGFTIRGFSNATMPNRVAIVENNCFIADTGTNETGALFISPQLGNIRNVIIRNNLAAGYVNNIILEATGGPYNYAGVQVYNNRMSLYGGYQMFRVGGGGPGPSVYYENYSYAPSNPDAKGTLVPWP